jgi:hypothetical protein
MKKLYLLAVTVALVGLSSPALAQQQINNDGASVNELQPQTQNVQNNAGSTQGDNEDITRDVGNSDVLKNADVDKLNVVGAPAGTTSTQDDNGFVSWLLFGFGILLVLMAPALLYARDIRRKTGSVTTKEALGEDSTQAEEPAETNTDDIDQVAVTNDIESDEAQESAVDEEVVKDNDKPKKKAKKNKANKAKRGKKKKK